MSYKAFLKKHKHLPKLLLALAAAILIALLLGGFPPGDGAGKFRSRNFDTRTRAPQIEQPIHTRTLEHQIDTKSLYGAPLEGQEEGVIAWPDNN